MRSIYSVALVLVMAVCGLSQGQGVATIKGLITDVEGKGVTGSVVVLTAKENEAEKYKAVTDENGHYMIPARAGEFILTASGPTAGRRFRSLSKLVTLSEGAVAEADLLLTDSGGILENVDVKISTGTAQPFSEVSKTVDIIDGRELRDRGEYSLTNALRTSPGFRVQQLGGFGRTASIKTRGLRNQDTAVLVDGQRLRDPASITGDASAFISDIGTSNTDRVEILRGSGSSIYGTNAIGGVIDIRSARPENGFHGNFQSEYGGLGFTRFAGESGFGTADQRFGISAGVSRTAFTRGIDGADDANNNSFRGRFEIRPASRLNVSAKVFISDAFVRLNSNPDTFGVLPSSGIIDAREGVNFVSDADDPDNYQRSNFISGQISAGYVVDSKTVISVDYQGLKTNRENENGELGVPFQPFGGKQFSYFDGQIHTLGAKLDWSPTRTGRLIAGYEYEVEKYANHGVGPGASASFLTEVDQSGNTAYVQYLQSFLDRRLQFAGGFRTQLFALTAPRFSIGNAPYSGLSLSSPPSAYTFDGASSYYLPRTSTKLRAHIGNGYRVPSLYERFGSFFSSFSQDFTALGDPDLKPERSIAFDAGIDQELAKGRLNLSATYFYTQLTDTIGYGNTVRDIGMTARPFGGYINTRGGISRGVEFAATLNPFAATSIFASYTLTNSDQREPQVAGTLNLRTLGVPDHRFTVNATQRIGERISLNFDFEASSSYLAPIFSNTVFSTFLYRFSGNRRGDLTARYELPIFGEKVRASLFATVENLFGYAYFENGFRTAGGTARGGMAVSF